MKDKNIFKNLKVKNKDRLKIFFMIVSSLLALVIIFIVSFYISYNKIVGEKNISNAQSNTSTDNKAVQNADDRIKELEEELAEKEEQIESLKLQIERYEDVINDLKNSGKSVQSFSPYSSGGRSNSDTSTPKPTMHPTPTNTPAKGPSVTPVPSGEPGNSMKPIPKLTPSAGSTVNGDVYKKAN